jgi:two-component system LytT family response regulator
MALLKTVIIEDEIPSQEVLVNYLDEYCKDVDILAVAKSLRAGEAAIKLYKPNLVITDIRLPDGLSFELFRDMKVINFKTIFTTAYSEYAVKAFRISATDYLLKPIKIDDLIESIEKVKAEIMQGTDLRNLEVLMNNMKNNDSAYEQLVVHDNVGFKVLEIKDIIMCKADGYCSALYLVGEQKITSSKILKYYEELLPPSQFIRVHNSFIINTKHVKSFSTDGIIGLSEGNTAAVGNTFKKRFIDHFNRMR